MSAELTERERVSWVDWSEVVAAERELRETEYASWDHLMLAMYSLIEPVRQNFGNVALLESDPGGAQAVNFIVMPRYDVDLERLFV